MSNDRIQNVVLDKAARNIKSEMISQGNELIEYTVNGAKSRTQVFDHKLGTRLRITIEYIERETNYVGLL